MRVAKQAVSNTQVDKTYIAEPTLIAFHMDKISLLRYIEGPFGCLPARTEFLTPTGWKAIGQYAEGDMVAQWEQDGTMTFVEPSAYVKLPCDEFIRFASDHRLLMEVTPEHRMPLYQFDGKFVVKTAAQVAAKPSRHTVPTTFKPQTEGMAFTDDQLKLMVAICADGCYPADNENSRAAKDYCVVTVRKERKKIRLRMLLDACDVAYTEYDNPNRETETSYRFYFRKLAGKQFSAEWWKASRRQLAVILTEVVKWDGHNSKDRLMYSSKHESDVDFIQYCAHACGLHGWKGSDLPRKAEWSVIHRVDISRPGSAKGKVMLRGDNVEIERVPSLDGFKYCFSVPSTFFIVRHEGRVFVTGNSGKSSGCIMDLMMLGMQQQPDANNVRRTRWAVIRQTYPELKSTTIKTFQNWIPNEVAPVVFGIPYTSKFEQNLGDGTRVEIEFIFLALEGPDDVKKLLSFELTGAYINEAREIAFEIVENLIGRIGRYPETVKDAEGNTTFGPSRPCIIADSNPPRTTHWLYTMFETGSVPKGWRKFKQPPAVYKEGDVWIINPDAENLSHLPENYYENQLSGGDDFVRVNLAGEFGMSRKGKPVWNKYVESKHVARERLDPMRGYPVIVGMDFGLTPAAVFLQVTGQGLRVLDELPATDEMLEDYLNEYVTPLIAARYQGYTIVACGDPSGNQRDRHTKQSDFNVLKLHNIKAFPAPTNDIIQRISAVNWFLTRDGGFVVSPHLIHLREAMAGGYILKEAKNASGHSTDTPVKNDYSHIADALQYGALFAKFGARQLQGRPASTTPAKPFLYA